MTVLVTGASGFIGRAVVRQLLARGRRVRVLVRRASPEDWGPGVDFVSGDVRGSSLAPAVDGVSAVVHLAAAVWGDDDEKFTSIAVGTERLLAALAGTPVRRVVLASTMAVYDWAAARGTVTEESPLLDPAVTPDAYAAAKVWSERLARRAAESAPWDLTILRPGFVWGPGRPPVAGLGQSAGPVTFVIGPLRTPPMIHRDNCAALIVEALEHPRAAGRTYNAVDPWAVSAWRYARRLRPDEHGFLVPVPFAPALQAVRAVQRIADAAFGGDARLPAAVTPDRFEARLSPVPLDGSRCREELGWLAPLSFAEAVGVQR